MPDLTLAFIIVGVAGLLIGATIGFAIERHTWMKK